MRRSAQLAAIALACLFADSAAQANDFESQPLRQAAPHDGPARFESVPARSSGIHFSNTYEDPEMWGRLYREFTLGEVGSGVAIGDYDNDGWSDIYAVSKTGPNKLYRQVAPFQFEDATEQAGVAGLGAWSTGATFVDIDNDGLLDIYLCHFAAPNELFVNQGDGAFREEASVRGLALVDASVMAAFADYDRDGDLDVYIVTNVLDTRARPAGQPDRLFRNEGNSFFVEATRDAGIAGDAQGHSATWWDYNHDGWPDLYVANDFENPDHLYRNNGDGTFTDALPQALPLMPYFSMGCDLGDIDNDGLTDFFVGDMAATSRRKAMTGIAELERGAWELAGAGNRHPSYMRNAFYLNNGTERFNEIAHLAGLAASDWTWAVKFGDLDNDGWNDLFITNGNIRNFMDADLLDRQNVASSMAARINVYRNAPPQTERNLAFRNEGDLRFSDVSATWGLDHLGVSFGAAFADLDRDGDLDLVVNNWEENLSVYRNHAANGNAALFRLRGRSSNRFGIGAILTLRSSAGVQVRQLTLARGTLSSDEPLAHFGLGQDNSVAELSIHWPSGHRQTLTNLQANRLYAITEPSGEASPPGARRSALDYRETAQFQDVSAARGLDFIPPESNFDELAQQPLLPRRLAKQGPTLAWGDVDADGDYDLVVGGAAGQPTLQFLNDGQGRFAKPQPLAFGPDPRGETLGIQFFNDTLILANGGVEGHYGATHGAEPISEIATSASVLATADFDGDGDLDLFVGSRAEPSQYPNSPRSYLLENREGEFIDVTDARAPGLRNVGMVVSALWSDADNDGQPDLLLALDWGHVSFFRNDGGRLSNRTQPAGLAPYTGWWNSIAAADLNEDGWLDYIVGNVGLNTKYEASIEKPTVLLAGAPTDGQASQLVEAQYAPDGLLYPIRPYSKLRHAFPSLRGKFATFDDYARATLEEVFPASFLATATRHEATTLSSGVFISSGQGAFRFQPLPRIAQVAPIFGIAAQDVDGDGHTDVYVVQNSYAPEPATGRFSGGVSQLLIGDGKGGLVPQSPARSGLVVPGDAKALTTIDFQGDGWPDFVLSQNGAPLLAFENRGAMDGHSFSVALRGDADNPRAIGAKITVERRDGTRSVAEIASASGYLSQSPPLAFFGYTDENAPTLLRVRWPDGTVSEHPFEQGTPRILLAKP